MKLADLVAKTRPVVITYGGETVNLVVRAEVLNTDFMVEMASLATVSADAEQQVTALKSLPDLLCRLVVSWDLEGDDGQPFPLVPSEVAKAIPVAFVSACIQGAAQSVGESSATGSATSSGATSSPKVPLAVSPNGTH